ncbi:hypothetical protein D3C71_2134700 [compost metagenome]
MLLIIGGTSPEVIPSAVITCEKESDTLPCATLARISPASNSGAMTHTNRKRIFSVIR